MPMKYAYNNQKAAVAPLLSQLESVAKGHRVDEELRQRADSEANLVNHRNATMALQEKEFKAAQAARALSASNAEKILQAKTTANTAYMNAMLPSEQDVTTLTDDKDVLKSGRNELLNKVVGSPFSNPINLTPKLLTGSNLDKIGKTLDAETTEQEANSLVKENPTAPNLGEQLLNWGGSKIDNFMTNDAIRKEKIELFQNARDNNMTNKEYEQKLAEVDTKYDKILNPMTDTEKVDLVKPTKLTFDNLGNSTEKTALLPTNKHTPENMLKTEKRMQAATTDSMVESLTQSYMEAKTPRGKNAIADKIMTLKAIQAATAADNADKTHDLNKIKAKGLFDPEDRPETTTTNKADFKLLQDSKTAAGVQDQDWSGLITNFFSDNGTFTTENVDKVVEYARRASYKMGKPLSDSQLVGAISALKNRNLLVDDTMAMNPEQFVEYALQLPSTSTKTKY